MLRKLYAFVQGRCREDKPDALANHELLLPGHLYGMIVKERIEAWLEKVNKVELSLFDFPCLCNRRIGCGSLKGVVLGYGFFFSNCRVDMGSWKACCVRNSRGEFSRKKKKGCPYTAVVRQMEHDVSGEVCNHEFFLHDCWGIRSDCCPS